MQVPYPAPSDVVNQNYMNAALPTMFSGTVDISNLIKKLVDASDKFVVNSSKQKVKPAMSSSYHSKTYAYSGYGETISFYAECTSNEFLSSDKLISLRVTNLKDNSSFNLEGSNISQEQGKELINLLERMAIHQRDSELKEKQKRFDEFIGKL